MISKWEKYTPLAGGLPQYHVALLHGKLKDDEKPDMTAFQTTRFNYWFQRPLLAGVDVLMRP